MANVSGDVMALINKAEFECTSQCICRVFLKQARIELPLLRIAVLRALKQATCMFALLHACPIVCAAPWYRPPSESILRLN